MDAVIFLAYKNADMTVVNKHGNTALHLGNHCFSHLHPKKNIFFLIFLKNNSAAEIGNSSLPLIPLLLMTKINTEATNKDKRTALHIGNKKNFFLFLLIPKIFYFKLLFMVFIILSKYF